MAKRSEAAQLRAGMALQPLTDLWEAEPLAFAEDWHRWLNAFHNQLRKQTTTGEPAPSHQQLAEAVHPHLRSLLRGADPELVWQLTAALYGDRAPRHYDTVVDALLAAKTKAPRKLLARR